MKETTIKINLQLYIKDRQEWRSWLEENHATASEAWLVFFKAHSRQACISYDDALDEALCFGWIDSLIQKLDEERYARKFTPRKNFAKWSQANQKRVARLIREGRMTAAGLAKVGELPADIESAPRHTRPVPAMLPQVEQVLRSYPQAWDILEGMPPSYQRSYIGWLNDAKRPETLEKRVQEAVKLLMERKPLGMK